LQQINKAQLNFKFTHKVYTSQAIPSYSFIYV
jgi:hypothetical protein